MLEDLLTETRRYWAQADVERLESEYHKMLTTARPVRSLAAAIKRDENISFLFEIKRKSPSRGVLDLAMNAAERARLYERYNASAVSVLTEEPHFGGTLKDLQAVSGAVNLPVLRKDFILNEVQLLEARACGADAVLLMAAILGNQTRHFVERCHELRLEPLVEVHAESELEIAIDSGSSLIGINNRNFDTLDVDLNVTARLLPLIPPGYVTVSESGFKSRRDVDAMRVLGVDAVLIGTMLSEAKSLSATLEDLTRCTRE